MRVKKWITNNIGVKVLSLVLAVMTWSYTNWELLKVKNQEERAIIDMLHYKVISRKLPVQLTVVGEAREGYKLVMNAITVHPETIIVIGPENILEEVDSVRTVPVDISEYTQDIKKEIPLAPIARGITLKDSMVSVHIPIVKTKKSNANEPSK